MGASGKYVDYFVMPVAKAELQAYQKFGEVMAVLAKKHGALDYVNYVADDVKTGAQTSFPQAVDLKDDEIVVCSMAIYRSREDRDRANKSIMEDPEVKKLGMPSGAERLVSGGFKVLRGIE